MWVTRFSGAIMWAGVLVAATATAAQGEITVDRRPAVVEHKTFDPNHPPSDLPPLNAGEAALTDSRFHCAVDLRYRTADRKLEGGRTVERLMVQSVHVRLEMNVTIWLPENAPAKLSAHEEGHRQILERVYGDAESIARRLSEGLDGRSIVGSGADLSAAERQAIRSAVDRFCHDYLARTAARASRVGDIYDDLTAHGTRAEPAEAEAIRQAFARADKPSTRPQQSAGR